jgi:hypothetical protein
MAFDLTKFDQASDADEFIEIALAGLSVISNILGPEIAGPVTGALKAVQTIIKSIQDAYDGKVTFEQVRNEFAELLASLEDNDAAADEALRRKFSTTETDKED